MATVDRVLPWRRHTPAINSPSEELAPILAAFHKHHPKASTALVQKAYDAANNAHRFQVRGSGESYINHPLAVARIVAEIGLDEISIAAALLHDSVEDTEITIPQVEEQFGAVVAGIVDGVTKLERIQFESKEAQQAASIRKMIVAMARDMRVLIIKLADRLHNMRTIAGMPAEKQRRIAQETLEIYAPLAHRLGMQEIRQQLEELSFASLYPNRYAELDYQVATRSPERDLSLIKTVSEVRARLAELGIKADVSGRGKHLWSLYDKMIQKGREFDEIFDLIAVRVIVETNKDCYAALGCIHGRWHPVVGRFKDYIAIPKFNLYRSLHTTVVGPTGKAIEVQIRTREMHQVAEWGVAAHWAYKEGANSADVEWLARIVDWQSDVSDPSQFMENLKTDLTQEEIYVFTPKGKTIALPVNSTTIDFAYAVHTEVGHTSVGAKVNGRLVPLEHRLRSGDTCEIFTSKVDSAGPSPDWLLFVVSQRAKNNIRQWYTRERREDATDSGRETLVRAFQRENLPVSEMWTSEVFLKELEAHGYTDLDTALTAIGDGHLLPRPIVKKVAKEFRADGEQAESASPMVASLPDGRPRRFQRARSSTGIRVEGHEDQYVRLSRCCTPVPGDEIMGFLTRGRGVSVHRSDCANAISLMAQQQSSVIEVEWSGDSERSVFRAGVEVTAFDRSRLLRDVANSLSEQHINIVACSTFTGKDRVAKMRFEFELADASHLDAVLWTIRSIPGVFEAKRLVPGGSSNQQ